MKITSVKAILSAPDKTLDTYGVLATRNYVYVKVETDEGIVGWGDATCGPLSVASMVEEFGQLLLGKDPSRIEEHWQTLYHFYHVRGGPDTAIRDQRHRDSPVGHQGQVSRSAGTRTAWREDERPHLDLRKMGRAYP